MATNSQWVTIEGGITNTFPLSINRTAYWTALRRGECYAQDMTNRNRRGALSFEEKPQPSSQFFIKKFVEEVRNEDAEIKDMFFYGRWWKVNGTRLIYSPLGRDEPEYEREQFVGYEFVEFPYTEDVRDPATLLPALPRVERVAKTETVIDSVNFIEDSDEPIKLVATDGSGRIFVIKAKCGYVIDNANQSPSVWRKSSPEFSIGTMVDEPSFTNAILNGRIALVWDGGGEHGHRHYMWSGSGAGIEISEDVREISETEIVAKNAAINWSQQLVLFGPLCYDMNARRIFYYSGKDTASYTSRPLYNTSFSMQTIYRMAFITDGKEGEFEAQIEYGQAFDDLQSTRPFRVKIRPNTKSRFRHIWNLDIPVLGRVWRVVINNLSGCSISQIDADISINDNPDFEEAL